MAKVKVEVTGAYVDGSAPGSVIEVEEKSAKYLEKVGYAKVIKEPQPKSAPKKKPAKTKEAK